MSEVTKQDLTDMKDEILSAVNAGFQGIQTQFEGVENQFQGINEQLKTKLSRQGER